LLSFLFFFLAETFFGNVLKRPAVPEENGIFMEFFEEQDAVLRQITCSLSMGTERSLRSDVKYLERFVGGNIKTALAFNIQGHSGVEPRQLQVIRATAANNEDVRHYTAGMQWNVACGA
jgi:hypothetical protein